MEITFNRKDLGGALGILADVAVKGNRAAEECVLIEALPDGRVTASASNLVSTAVLILPQVEVAALGQAMVSADELRQAVCRSPDDTIYLAVKGDRLIIKDGDGEFALATQNPDDFLLRRAARTGVAQVSAGVLKRLIARTRLAAHEGLSPGVRLESDGRQIIMVGTDGRRLAKDAGMLVSGDGRIGVNLPIKSMATLLKVLHDDDETVEVLASESDVAFHTYSARLICTLREGQFPPYADVLQGEPNGVLTAAAGELAAAIERVQFLADERGGIVLKLGPKVLLCSEATGRGTGRVGVAARYEGAPTEMIFNPKYLLDGLKVLGNDHVRVDLMPTKAILRSASYESAIMALGKRQS